MVIAPRDVKRLLETAPPHYEGMPSPVNSGTWKLVTDEYWYATGRDFQDVEVTLQVNGASTTEFVSLAKATPANETSCFAIWARENGHFRGLCSEAEHEEWLPACCAVWPELENQTLSSGLRFLNEQIQSRTESFQLLGVRISATMLAICIPAFTAAICLFMIPHLQQLAAQRGTPSVGWIAMYRGWMSQSVTFATIMVLPAAAITLSIVNTSTSRWIALPLGVIAMYCTWLVFRSIRQFHLPQWPLQS